MNELIIAISGLITAGGTGFFTFLFMKSKYKQDVEQLKVNVLQSKESVETIAIDNDIKLTGHYKEIIDDLKPRYEKRYQEFEEIMNRKFSLLEEEIKLKDRKIKLQQIEITELKKENKALKANASST
jgi:hypothetical protein